MAAVKKQRGADNPDQNRRVQLARVAAAVTGEPELNRAQRRLIARGKTI